MTQITLHLEDDIAARLELEAVSQGISVSDYLVKLVFRACVRRLILPLAKGEIKRGSIDPS
jgi:hypothetical protein